VICGVGIDVCPITRLGSALERHPGRFVARVFTVAERAYCDRHAFPAQHYAVRFAAKEAAFKALGGPAGVSWRDLEVTNGGGAPRLLVHGPAAAAAARSGVRRTHLSLTHAGDAAVAVVILED
jgi:holo-[acyl-carrier protein] synthase